MGRPLKSQVVVTKQGRYDCFFVYSEKNVFTLLQENKIRSLEEAFAFLEKEGCMERGQFFNYSGLFNPAWFSKETCQGVFCIDDYTYLTHVNQLNPIDAVPCYVCQQGKVIQWEKDHEWYRCTHCKADSSHLSEGAFYPLSRRKTLCTLYTPVHGLDVNLFQPHEAITFLTIRGTRKTARVLHVSPSKNRMIIREDETGKTRFLIHYQSIMDAYDHLVPEAKREFSGWWNRRISFI